MGVGLGLKVGVGVDIGGSGKTDNVQAFSHSSRPPPTFSRGFCCCFCVLSSPRLNQRGGETAPQGLGGANSKPRGGDVRKVLWMLCAVRCGQGCVCVDTVVGSEKKKDKSKKKKRKKRNRGCVGQRMGET